MILLDYHNRIIEDTLKTRFNPDNKPKPLEMDFVDFDGVSYHLATLDNQDTKIILSIRWKCWPELIRYGAMDTLRRQYSQWIVDPEPNYDFTLQFDVENLGADPESVIRRVSLLKRNAMASPFERAFDATTISEKEGVWDPSTSQLMEIHYRDGEAIYVKNNQDSVTVFFSTLFKDETDRVLAKVFLQEFVDARKEPQLQNAPQVLYSNREPPLELRHVPGLLDSESMGYITFILFPRHFTPGPVREETISRIQIFRDYLHYHIKCSKAYMHSRMRARVAEFLKVLNRAKPEIQGGEKKLASGRTFRRAA
ncbi:MAG: Arp2/3 complex, 34 kd subunit p34-Arc-domain-containing protein [Benniella sp.]|nr:MAG: Arp2/3 complex, 34 kd subunit p34-Arc-domain-containing protein [Benniella sp.]